MNEVKELVEELRNKKSRDNRELLDRSADMIEKLAKELCEKSGCHHKCRDTKDCIVEEEAELLINQTKSNNFEVKSNNELFKQALVEGLNRRFDKTIEEAKKIEQIEEMANDINMHCCSLAEQFCGETSCNACLTNFLYNAGYRKLPENIGEFSDGYHTFNELYHHRAILFSVICNMFPEKAWKSKLHDTGDMFDGMFIVGIETEQGQATYHYDIEPYWDMFKVKELQKAPKWDGHTPSDAIQRIGNIKQSEGEWKRQKGRPEAICSECGREVVYQVIDNKWAFENYCPHCGLKMKGGE